MSNNSDDLHKLYTSRAALFLAARTQANACPAPLSQSVFYYYVTRYLVAVQEARNLMLPIQVWNEYRNALDHFMRHVTNANGEDAIFHQNDQHLKKMEGHLLRAALDACKILCVRSQEKIDAQLSTWGKDVLDLVDGGDFYAEAVGSKQNAVRLIEEAKVVDALLGKDDHSDEDILGQYVDAVFEFDAIYQAFIDKLRVLQNAKDQLSQHANRMHAETEATKVAIRQQLEAELAPKAWRRSLVVGMIASLLVGMPLGWLFSSYGTSFISALSVDAGAVYRDLLALKHGGSETINSRHDSSLQSAAK